MQIFDFIHKNYNELTVLDIKEEKDYKKILIEFCNKNNISIKSVKYDNDLLEMIIRKLKVECDLTNIKIAELLGISRNKVGEIVKIIKNQKF